MKRFEETLAGVDKNLLAEDNHNKLKPFTI